MNSGSFCGCSYDKSLTILGSIAGLLILGNSHVEAKTMAASAAAAGGLGCARRKAWSRP